MQGRNFLQSTEMMLLACHVPLYLGHSILQLFFRDGGVVSVGKVFPTLVYSDVAYELCLVVVVQNHF